MRLIPLFLIRLTTYVHKCSTYFDWMLSEKKQDYSLIESPKFYTKFIQIKHKLSFSILKNKNKNKLAILGFVGKQLIIFC